MKLEFTQGLPTEPGLYMVKATRTGAPFASEITADKLHRQLTSWRRTEYEYQWYSQKLEEEEPKKELPNIGSLVRLLVDQCSQEGVVGGTFMVTGHMVNGFFDTSITELDLTQEGETWERIEWWELTK